MNQDQAAKTPAQPAGRVVATTANVAVSEIFDLDTGYARQGWHEFLWFSGWRAKVAVFVLRALASH